MDQLPQEKHTTQFCVHHSPLDVIILGPQSSPWLCCQKFGQVSSGNQHERLILDPENTKSLEVFADANFCRNWHKPTVLKDVSTTKSPTSYVIMYTVCPNICASKLQIQITLSKTEAGYLVLSQSLQECISVSLLYQ